MQYIRVIPAGGTRKVGPVMVTVEIMRNEKAAIIKVDDSPQETKPGDVARETIERNRRRRRGE